MQKQEGYYLHNTKFVMGVLGHCIPKSTRGSKASGTLLKVMWVGCSNNVPSLENHYWGSAGYYTFANNARRVMLAKKKGQSSQAAWSHSSHPDAYEKTISRTCKDLREASLNYLQQLNRLPRCCNSTSKWPQNHHMVQIRLRHSNSEPPYVQVSSCCCLVV